jgi:hypothetical protein
MAVAPDCGDNETFQWRHLVIRICQTTVSRPTSFFLLLFYYFIKYVGPAHFKSLIVFIMLVSMSREHKESFTSPGEWFLCRIQSPFYRLYNNTTQQIFAFHNTNKLFLTIGSKESMQRHCIRCPILLTSTTLPWKQN